MDTDLDFARLTNGIEISRTRKLKKIIKDECRTEIKEHLQNGNYTPWKYLEEISKTIGKIADHYVDTEHFDYSDNSETEENSESTSTTINNCVICLSHRMSTWIFLPCRHANCCAECSNRIEELGHICPTCRSPIEELVIPL